VETTTLATAIPVPVEVPPGLWRREGTHCPKPFSPFLRAALGIVSGNFQRAFEELGVMADRLEYREIGGWVYTGIVPLGGGDQPPTAEQIRERADRALDVVMTDRFAAYVDRWPEWRAESVAGVAHLRDVDVAALDDAGLGGHFNDIMEFSLPVYDLHFLLHGIGAMMLTDLVRTCQELLGWDEARALELLCGLSHASSEPSRVIAGLAAMARERPAVRRCVESGECDLATLSEIDAEFAAAFADYQHEFGFRAIRYDVVDPSIGETPALTLRLIADQLRSGFDPEGPAADAGRRRAAAEAEARAGLAGRPDEDPARFERALQRAQRWYPVREDEAPMTFSELFSLVRRVAVEIGRRLTADAVLDDPDDVFFLEMEEAFAALAGRHDGSGPNCRQITARRLAERAWVDAHPGPVSYGEPFRCPASTPWRPKLASPPRPSCG